MTDNTCPWCEANHQGRPFSACLDGDLLSQASLTGRNHARRGYRCASDIATRLFGERVARAYEDGYRRETARVAEEPAA